MSSFASVPSFGKRRDAERDGRPDRLARRLDLEPLVGDGAADPLGDLERLLRRRLRQEDRELLAAEARGDVGVAKVPLEDVGDPLQDGVAGEVAVGVVDVPQQVEVGHDHRRAARSERRARSSSSRSALAKWRALKRPSSGRPGPPAGARGRSASGGRGGAARPPSAGAAGSSPRAPRTATPSRARTKSVERLSTEKRPVPRNECPRARWSIVASRTWFSETKTSAATRPESANSRFGPSPALRTSSTAPHAASPFSVWLAMLNAWMYQG